MAFPVVPFLGKALANLFRKPSTIAFPAGDPPAAEPGYRGRILYDAGKCINCGMCERVCAPHCMERTQKPAPGGAPGDMEVTFDFDMTCCTFCGLCADFCSTKAITLSQDYMIIGNKEDLHTVGTFIKKAPPKPKFTPEQLAAMKAAAEAKRAAAAAAAKS